LKSYGEPAVQIGLPADIVERVQKRPAAANGVSEVEAIRQALDSLDWRDQERQAIPKGIDARRTGDTQDFDAFDAEFQTENDFAHKVT
jgi:hypothetical protein